MVEWNKPSPQKGGKELIPPGALGLVCDDAKIWQCFSLERRGLSLAHRAAFCTHDPLALPGVAYRNIKLFGSCSIPMAWRCPLTQG